jgi:hypothetical protein
VVPLFLPLPLACIGSSHQDNNPTINTPHLHSRKLSKAPIPLWYIIPGRKHSSSFGIKIQTVGSEVLKAEDSASLYWKDRRNWSCCPRFTFLGRAKT